MNDVAIIHLDEDGPWAEVPALDGCYTQGDSVEEILRLLPDAIATHIDGMKRDGRVVPDATSVIVATLAA